MSTKSAMKLNLKQCLDIKANQYRSSDNQFDYDDVEIETRIVLLQANRQARELKQLLDELDNQPTSNLTGKYLIDPDLSMECPDFNQELADMGYYDSKELSALLDSDTQDYYRNDNGSLVAIPEQIIPF